MLGRWSCNCARSLLDIGEAERREVAVRRPGQVQDGVGQLHIGLDLGCPAPAPVAVPLRCRRMPISRLTSYGDALGEHPDVLHQRADRRHLLVGRRVSVLRQREQAWSCRDGSTSPVRQSRTRPPDRGHRLGRVVPQAVWRRRPCGHRGDPRRVRRSAAIAFHVSQSVLIATAARRRVEGVHEGVHVGRGQVVLSRTTWPPAGRHRRQRRTRHPEVEGWSTSRVCPRPPGRST